MSDITVVIPCRDRGRAEVTLATLAQQTLKPARILPVWDEGRGANWARNLGAAQAETPLILFSDDDIAWRPAALEILAGGLAQAPDTAYSYGAYMMGGKVYCDQPFDPWLLSRTNYISTMSLIRRALFPGFDESIRRLQDWDLWLTMLSRGHVGTYVGQILFETARRPGITFGGAVTWYEADLAIKQKHGL